VSTSGSSATYRFTNPAAEEVRVYELDAWYQLEVTAARTNTETNQLILLVRSTDDTSIAKYGRRTMDLDWPYGQTEAQMKAVCDAYLLKHSEWVPSGNYSLQGKTDALITQILTRDIDDLIKIVSTKLGLSADFFITSVSRSHMHDQLLECQWAIEMIRGTDNQTLWMWDTSLWDGGDSWAQ